MGRAEVRFLASRFRMAGLAFMRTELVTMLTMNRRMSREYMGFNARIGAPHRVCLAYVCLHQWRLANIQGSVVVPAHPPHL
jgi:hypothetical protein